MDRRQFLGGMVGLSMLSSARATVEPLAALHADFESGRYPGVDSMVVLHRGRTVWSASYPAARPLLVGAAGPYNYSDPDWHPVRDGLHTMQSVTKSVLSALIGVALRRQDLQSVSQPVSPFFPEAPIDPELTLQDLLTMQTGLAWKEDLPYEDPANDWAAMERSSDWLAFVLAKSGGLPKRYNYSSGVPILMAAMLTRATGRSIESYAEEHLFRPLGIDNFFWKITPTGLADTQGGLYLSSADLARFGAHYLSQDAWVRESIQPRALADDWRYGYQWWLLPHPHLAGQLVPTALGYGGQRLFVFPQHELVAAFTGWNPGGKGSLPIEQALNILVSAI